MLGWIAYGDLALKGYTCTVIDMDISKEEGPHENDSNNILM